MADARASVEADLLSELNRARQQPAAVAAQIEQRLAHYRGLDYFPPERGGKIAVPSKEGAAAVRDAVAFMRSQAPLPPLAFHRDEADFYHPRLRRSFHLPNEKHSLQKEKRMTKPLPSRSHFPPPFLLL